MAVGLSGSIPQINRSGITPGTKALFHSVRDIALIIDKTCKAGYGYLKAGTVMAINSADLDLVPYPEAAFATNLVNAKVWLVADTGITATTLQILNEETYKMALGDSLVIVDDTTAAEDLGAITDIALGDNGIAIVTFTTAIGGVAFTVANTASIVCKSDTSAGFTKAIYILDQDINTGTGADALGANTSVVISNAVLYSAPMLNLDAAAITDLGVVTDGRFAIVK